MEGQSERRQVSGINTELKAKAPQSRRQIEEEQIKQWGAELRRDSQIQ